MATVSLLNADFIGQEDGVKTVKISNNLVELYSEFGQNYFMQNCVHELLTKENLHRLSRIQSLFSTLNSGKKQINLFSDALKQEIKTYEDQEADILTKRNKQIKKWVLEVI